MKISIGSITCLSFLLCSPTLSANTGGYLGTRLGATHFQDACVSGSSICHDTSLGYGIYGGYDLTHWLAFEAAVTDYGSIDSKSNGSRAEAKIWGGDISAKFNYDFSSKTQLFARVGGGYIRANDTTFFDRQTSGGAKLVTGLGFEHTFYPQWSLRGEYQFIDGVGDSRIGKADLHFASIGISYHFSGSKPIPKPTVIHEKEFIIKHNQTIHLGSAPLFSFDSTELFFSKRFKVAFEKIKEEDNKFSKLHVVGYTDSSGSAAYNLKLSQERAQAVAEYITTLGIPSSQIDVDGQGEKEPIGDNSTAAGRAMNRRVEIYFTTINEEMRP
ncbi:OmpA family protein [Aliivibrio sifiae]|uniref:OmpA family protein n=1 Tax=Aliivibrio sifiae TaxID=566293 RepID=UPI003D0D4186